MILEVKRAAPAREAGSWGFRRQPDCLKFTVQRKPWSEDPDGLQSGPISHTAGCPMSDPLQRDLRAFEADRSRLLQTDPGRFAVYADGQRIGVFDSEESAAQAAIVKHALQRFLLREVVARDPVYALHPSHCRTSLPGNGGP